MIKPVIDRIIAGSSKPLSLQEIIDIRYADVNGVEVNMASRVSEVNKYIRARTRSNMLFTSKRQDGTEVWADSKEKLANDADLDSYRKPLRELFQAQGMK